MSCVDLSYHMTRTLDKGVNFDASKCVMPAWQYNSARCQADSTVAHLAGGQVPVALRGGGRAIITAALLVPWQAHGTAHGAMNERTRRRWRIGPRRITWHGRWRRYRRSPQPADDGPTPRLHLRDGSGVVNLILLSRTPKDCRDLRQGAGGFQEERGDRDGHEAAGKQGGADFI